MKKIKHLAMGLMFIGMTALVGCKKEDMSKYATKEDLQNYATNNDNQSKVVNFSITFTPSKAWGTVPYIDKKESDIVLLYTHLDDLGGEPTWAPIPVVVGSINVVPEYVGNTIFIHAKKTSDNSYVNFTNNTTIGFKAVVLSFSGLSQQPDVDLTNYKEVSKAFNLE